jgi:hypothetical protein
VDETKITQIGPHLRSSHTQIIYTGANTMTERNISSTN